MIIGVIFRLLILRQKIARPPLDLPTKLEDFLTAGTYEQVNAGSKLSSLYSLVLSIKVSCNSKISHLWRSKEMIPMLLEKDLQLYEIIFNLEGILN